MKIFACPTKQSIDGKVFSPFLFLLSIFFYSCLGIASEESLQLLPIKGPAGKPNRYPSKNFRQKDIDYAIANQDYALAAEILSRLDALEAETFQKYLDLIENGFGMLFMQTLNRDGVQEALPYYYSLQSLAVADQYISVADFSEQLFDYYVKKEYFAAALSLAQNTLQKDISLDSATKNKFQDFLLQQFGKQPQSGQKSQFDRIDEPDFWEQRMGGTVTIFVKMGTERIPSTQLYLPSIGLGSGFFIDNRGSIITNHHVISNLTQKQKNQSQIFVKLSERDELIPARLLGWDSNRDLALLQISRPSPYLLRMNDNFHLLQNDSAGEKPDLAIGKELYAIGAPGGLGNTLTSGRVSARGRKILPLSEALQVDVPANPGNSGGPLLNSQGFIEGIVFAKNNAGYEGIAFAIPSDTLGAILPRLYQRGEVQNSWLGLLVDEYSNDEDYLEIRYIFPGSAADQSSLRPGMRIVSYRGNRYSKVKRLQNQVANAPIGSLITLTTKKGDAQKTFFLELRQRPNKPMYPNLQQESTSGLFYALFGAELQASAGKRNVYQVTSTLPNSQVSELGINEGDYIQIIKWLADADKNLIFAHIAYQYKEDLEQRAKQSVLIQQLDLPNIL